MVLTPPKTAEYMVSKLSPINKDAKILDPCVGPGVFIRELLNNGTNESQIVTHDKKGDYKDDMKDLKIQFKTRDTLLDFNEEDHDQFDLIIGNPPYLNKSSEYIRSNRKELRKIYGKINAHETYAMFLVNSIWRLKEGGKLVFITSDSFLTLRTHTKLRKFILNNCLIEEILLAPRNLFDEQDVSTSPVIITLQKRSKKEEEAKRKENIMRIISRIENEGQYENPPNIRQFKQKRYWTLPFCIFFHDVDETIINFFTKAPKLKKYIKGYIGMHTHDNLKYIAAIEGTELGEIFEKRNTKKTSSDKKYKIIKQKEFESGKWKAYLKRGGADQYYRPIMEALDWDKDSIPIYDIPKNVPFEHQGLVISGVSSRLAVRYMHEGCYWDSNKAIGFIIQTPEISIEYALGCLNSSLYNYLAKGIINNTSSIQITGIHALPFIIPDKDTKAQVEELVSSILKAKKENLNYDYANEQEQIDDLIFRFHAKKFNIPEKVKKKLDDEYSIYNT